jgi:hypothetical protein
MRQLLRYVAFGYAGLFAVAFVVMLIHPSHTGMLPIALALPWSGLAGLYLNQCSFINNPTNPNLAIATIELIALAGGLLNIAILFGVSRFFKKTN